MIHTATSLLRPCPVCHAAAGVPCDMPDFPVVNRKLPAGVSLLPPIHIERVLPTNRFEGEIICKACGTVVVLRALPNSKYREIVCPKCTPFDERTN